MLIQVGKVVGSSPFSDKVAVTDSPLEFLTSQAAVSEPVCPTFPAKLVDPPEIV